MTLSGSPRLTLAAVVLGLLCAVPAGAQTRAEGASGWSFEVSPYLWAAGLDGTIRPLANGSDFRNSLSFGDIPDDPDAGLFLTGTARRDRFVMRGDLSYIPLSDTVRRRVQGQRATVRGTADILQGSLLAGWQAVDTPAASLDLLGGVRAGENDIALRARAGGTTIRRGRDDITYTAPILGMRGQVALSDRVSLTGYGDLGGGTSSVDSTWQLSATLDFHVSDRTAVSVGYRHQTLDITNGSARSNTDTSGFLVGTRLRF